VGICAAPGQILALKGIYGPYKGGRIEAHSLAEFTDGQGIELQYAEDAVL